MEVVSGLQSHSTMHAAVMAMSAGWSVDSDLTVDCYLQ